MKIILFLFAALVQVAVNAAAPVAVYTSSVTGAKYTEASLTTASADCALRWGGGAQSTGAPIFQTSTWNGLTRVDSACGRWTNGVWSTISQSSFWITGVWQCSNGTAPNTSKPLAEQCDASCPTAGTEYQLRVPQGWDTTPNPLSSAPIAYPASPPSSFCFQTAGQSCSYTDSGPVLEEGFLLCKTDDTPGPTGLYRTSCRHKLVSTGTQCTASSANDESNLNPSPPPCQGYQGTVNGKTVCIPTIQPPTPFTPAEGAPATQSDAHTPSATGGGRAPSESNTPAADGPAGAGTGSNDGGGTTGMGRGSGAGKNTLEGSPAGALTGGGGGGGGLSKADLPTDYNRETTQQEIRDSLKSSSSMGDQGKVVSDASTKGEGDLTTLRTDIQNGMQGDKDRFFSWVWSPPMGSCQPFSGTVHGFAIAFDICNTVANIREVLGWMLAIFAALQVYGQLFKRED